MHDESDGEDAVQHGVNGRHGGRTDERDESGGEESFERPVVRSVRLGRGGEGRGVVDGSLDVGCGAEELQEKERSENRFYARWLAWVMVAPRASGEAVTAAARPVTSYSECQRAFRRGPTRKITGARKGKLTGGEGGLGATRLAERGQQSTVSERHGSENPTRFPCEMQSCGFPFRPSCSVFLPWPHSGSLATACPLRQLISSKRRATNRTNPPISRQFHTSLSVFQLTP